MDRDAPAESAQRAKRRSGERPAPAPGPTVRVLCVDDHALLIEGLKAQFSADGGVECVASLPSASALIEAVGERRPDAVLMDIEMPGPDVFEMADRLRHAHPDIPFIFLSAHVRDGYLAAAYKAGASGYFAKGDDLEEIVDGVKKVARSPAGAFVMGTKVRDRCTPGRAGDETPPPTPLATLTAREIEVLRLIGKGLSRTEIAAELSRSAKTVDGHQDRMMKKLRIESRAELMRYAIREGLAEA